MAEVAGSPAPRELTVEQLIAELATAPPHALVGAFSDCHGCGGTNLTIKQGHDSRGDHVWISGDLRLPDA